MEQQLSIFDLDEYEQRALMLRTVIMRRKHAEPLTPVLISMLARALGTPGERITHVLTDIGDQMGWSADHQRAFKPALHQTLKRFGVEIDIFSRIYMDAALHGGPRIGRQAWRDYLNNVIDLFEHGEKGQTVSEPLSY